MPTDKQVVVSLTEKFDGSNSRRITLDEKNNSCLLGRASRKGTDIIAQPDNGYFENPVVSRNHAEIRADFAYERVYVKDIGSTHGTFVNNVRLPATVRHPIRTGDNITLGVEIKGQGSGFDPVRPSIMTVGVKFGTKPFVVPNVFQVPDETSVEGSDPEDTFGRARRFLLENGNSPAYDAIDLTNDVSDGRQMGFDIRPPLSQNPLATRRAVHNGYGLVGIEDSVGGGHEIAETFGAAMGAADMPDSGKDEEVQDRDLELPVESDLSESDAEDYHEDDVEDEDEEEEVDDEEDDEDDIDDEEEFDEEVDEEAEDVDEGDLEPGEQEPCALVDDIPTGAGHKSEAPVDASWAKSADMHKESEAGADSSRPDEATPLLKEGSPQSAEDVSLPRDVTSPAYEDEDVTMQVGASRLPAEAAGHEATGGQGHATVSKKRKASEISREPEAVANVLSASGVQTDPSVEREPKRLRRAADIVGYTALGGLAGALAVFTTLVLSAPSFS